MSRRTGRSQSSAQKRKKSDAEGMGSALVAETPSKPKKSKHSLMGDNLDPKVSPPMIPTFTDEGTQTERDEPDRTREDDSVDKPRSSFSDINKRAIEARRRLDLATRRQMNTSMIKKSFALLNKAMDLHFRSLTSRLKSCQKSNRKLQNDIKVLKDTIDTMKTPRTKTRCLTVKQARHAKGPRPQTVVVTVPDDHLEDQLRLETVVENELIVDQKVSNTKDAPKSSYSSDGNFTFITLNSEEDFPDGSWLGDVNSPAMRVRCKITPAEMVQTMTVNKSAEKLALKLLDLLFDKDTQATSNLSGVGKHKKKKLDPLLIYGIHCHLVKHFNITHEDWYRIRQNIDSKCRTAFRRKLKGLELNPKLVKKEKSANLIHTTQIKDYQQNQAVQHLQHVVSELQTIPTDGLTSIAIIQEQSDGSSIMETNPTASSLIGHILQQEGEEIHQEQLKEVIAQAGTTNAIHLSNGQTIAISQSGELEIREVHMEVSKD